MSLVYTEEQLAEMGYVEVSPGRFQRSKNTAKLHKSKKKNSAFAHLKSGNYMVGGHVLYLRSGWEYIYAQYLEFLKTNGAIKDWEYEPHTFYFEGVRRGNVSYKPDFKVTELDGNHWWAEVKGYLDPPAKTKLKRMAKYFPDEKVCLIREDKITEIVKSGVVQTA